MSRNVQDEVQEIVRRVLDRFENGTTDGAISGRPYPERTEAASASKEAQVLRARLVPYETGRVDGGSSEVCGMKNEGGSRPRLNTGEVAALSEEDVDPAFQGQLKGCTVSGVAIRDQRLLRDLLRTTPARIGVGRSGPRPCTETLLTFREDHAAAVDAVYGEVDEAVLEEFGLFVVDTMAADKDTYIRRPDLGRKLTPQSVHLIQHKCVKRPQVQVVVSDGLSSQAVMTNLKDVYPALCQSLKQYGLSMGTPFYVRRGRVAIMDEIGELLQPEAFVLLIGERPGLAAADSMSAYLCYRPRRGTIEADRMVVSNIHDAGTPPVEAGAHLGAVVKTMIEKKASGVKLMSVE
ncbi:ethanolamine ammonia-lyase subunit EutC [Kyrpidia spormannii]|uniref:Ethanolamine ammonia-lyase small subunit n=1 Tax=Kyrpidia spormannii TaxID=2055160 RepID=A0A6F9EG46_9BACL|nr:ethanolamine ammonia-lyase subunit EutC [Kyrpidia spormannii]CAB3395301.1 Ethanolamine ammonia-lyase light chain (modular protein) [Kyrpidia spormannii]